MIRGGLSAAISDAQQETVDIRGDRSRAIRTLVLSATPEVLPASNFRAAAASCDAAASAVWILLPGALRESSGVHGGFGAAAHPELEQEVGDVVLGRLLGEEHLFCDLAVG